ncbi:phage holin family protein [Isoptericola jiangsuensis]|uniref:phage holin family protein n=1 Tax=Isoptericola jiangsuensis TaxID=548579 RepID=UPI003AAD7EB7
MNFILRVVATGLALWLCDLIFDSVVIYPTDDVLSYILGLLGVSLIFALVSMIVKPIVTVLSIPLLVLTLGLFYLLINAFMLWITTWLTGQDWLGQWGLQIDGDFWWYLWVALILAILQALVGLVIPDKKA